MQTQTPPAPAGWYDDPSRPGGQRYWDEQQWTDDFREPPREPPPEPPLKAKKPWHRRWWVWALGGFVLLVIMGALIPAEETKQSNAPQTEGDQTAAKAEPTVALTLDAPDVVKGQSARIDGTIEATNAKGDSVSGSVVSVFIGGFGGRSVNVRSDGTFAAKVRLRNVGTNDFDVLASWVMADIEDSQSVTITREQSAAELAAIRERRAAQREAQRQEVISSAETIDYDQLMKNPEAFAGDSVKYTGQIFQIQEDPAGGGVVLLAVTDEGYGFWSDNIWVNYKGKVQGAEDDMLTVYGTVVGSKSYETQIGGETYVPEIDAEIIEE